MKLHSDANDAHLRISAYDRHSVTVGGSRMSATFLITPSGVHTARDVPAPADLRWQHLEQLHAEEVQILILGTGTRQQFPPAELFAELSSRRVGLEVMDTPAACRTYNILAAEGRRVAALIVLN